MGKLRLLPRGRGFVCGVALLTFASLGYARTAQANMAFPAELQKQLEERFPGKKFCVPLCTACHTLTTGGPDHYNAFGKALYDAGLNVPSVAKLDTVLTELLDKNLDSDGDGKSDNDELKDFEAPGFYGSAAFCTDLTYGCGARIASAPPPVDRLALFSAGFVVLGLAALRRQRRPRKAA